MNIAISMIALGLSLITSVIAVTTIIVQMRSTVAAINKENERKEARDDKESDRRQHREDQATKEIQEFFLLLKSFIAAQTEINKQVETGLIGAMDKLQDLQKQMNESETVKQLLIELVKKKSPISIEP